MYSPLIEMLQQFWVNLKIWLAVNLLFCTKEMKEEVRSHETGAACRIPEAWNSFNVFNILRIIGERFPGRKDIKIDYVLGICKSVFILITVFTLLGFRYFG